jgi:hypothetical protein
MGELTRYDITNFGFNEFVVFLFDHEIDGSIVNRRATWTSRIASRNFVTGCLTHDATDGPSRKVAPVHDPVDRYSSSLDNFSGSRAWAGNIFDEATACIGNKLREAMRTPRNVRPYEDCD